MRLYMAAPYAGRDLVRETAVAFTSAGHELTSGWLQASRAIVPETLGIAKASTHDEVVYHARKDLTEVEEADVLVHWTARFLQSMDPTLGDVTHQLHSGGRHVETGYALALGKPIVLLGEPENIFQRGLAHVCPSIADALDVLDEMDEDWA